MTTIDRAALDAAVAAAEADEPDLPRDMTAWLQTTLSDEPITEIHGPVSPTPRGGPTGVVIVGGDTVATWGEPDRSDMTFSIAKSTLALVAGAAHDDGLLVNLDEPADARVGCPELADTGITWRHLLTQTSDWRGELFGLPWWGDPQGRQEATEPVHGPGVRFAYNDIRTNLCSLALTHLHQAGGAEVFAERIAVPLGFEHPWSWHGLHDMTTELADGRRVEVVTGGSHWGGGLWMSSIDLAKIGQMMVAHGRHDDRRVLSETWIARLLEPCPAREAYGLMWWRNPEAGRPAAGDVGATAAADAFFAGSGIRGFAAVGTGQQVVWCDPDRDLVAVIRWSRDPFPILAAITAAVAAS